MIDDLSRTPFAEVLCRASAERRSGDLVVADEHAPPRTLFMDQGRLVAASSEDPQQRLGTYLVAQGRVRPEDVTLAEARIRAGSQRRIGEALVAAGVLRRDEVGRAVARLAKEIALSLFPLSSGTARLVEGEPSVPVEAMVGISLHRLLYVGIRKMRRSRLIEAGLGPLDRTVLLAGAPPFRFILRKCPPGELRILEQVRKPITMRELVTEGGKVSPARVKAVYALLASGVIEDVAAPPDEPRPVAHVESNTFLLSDVEGPGTEPQGASLRLEVEQELLFAARLDTESWMRVSSRDDVVRALEAKRRRYVGFLDRATGDADLLRDVESLIGKITVFLLRLTEDAPRAPGTAATQTVPPLVRTWTEPPDDERPRKVPVGRRPVRVGGDTGPPSRRPGDSGPVPRRRTGDWTPAVGTHRPDVSRRPGDSGPVPRVKAGDSGRVPRVREGDSGPTPAVRAGDSGPVPRIRPGDSGPTPVVREGDSGSTPSVPADPADPGGGSGSTHQKGDVEPISQLVRNGELRMSLNDFGSATQIYRRLVERAPDVAGYRLRLALAMARWPPTAREAEREFLEAVRRDPNNPRIHYQFALYYKSLDLGSRATEEMRTAVALDPQNEGAREHLRDLSPDDPLLDDQTWG